MTQDIFRFVAVGAPPRPELTFRLRPDYSSISSRLISLNRGGDGRERLRVFARNFLSRPEFLGDPARLPLTASLDDFSTRIAAQDRFTSAMLADAVQAAFGMPAARAIEATSFRTGVQQLGDGLLALMLEPSTYPTLLETYVRLLRAADLIVKVAEQDPSLEGLRRRVWSSTPLELPDGLFPLTGASAPSPPEPPETGDDGAATNKVAQLQTRLLALDEAREELLAFSAEDLQPQERVDRATRLVVRGAALRGLSAPTRAILTELEPDEDSLSPSLALARLQGESARARRELARARDQASAPASVHVGSTTLPIALLAPPAPSAASPPALPGNIAAPNVDVEDQIWSVGSLLVTSMQILAYEAGEVAHIENVLRGETKERETRRLRRIEETTTVEVETTKEEERDLQTTERLEMQREVQNTIRESQQFSVGGTVSAGYGPFVQVTVNTQYATDSSSEEIARAASNYSREITERTASKITERIREEQTIRVVQEFEERNLHRLDGAGADEHIVGLFQWVDKLYQVQCFDYGTRLLGEVVISEPARFLLQAVLAEQSKQASSITPPERLDIGPLDLSPSTYDTYVEHYGAKGVNPPPDPTVTLSAVFEKPTGGLEPPAEGEEEGDEAKTPATVFTATQIVTIPSGYRAVSASVTARSVDAVPNKADVPYGVTVVVGRRPFGFINPDDGTVIKGQLDLPLDDQVGSLPITLMAKTVTHYVVGVEIECNRTTAALRAWQLRTYEAILDAYLARVAEYNEQLAELAAREGIVIEGRNPLENRRIERTELKRLALSTLLRSQLVGFGAYNPTSPVPTIDFDAAEEQGRFIRLFEHAFEWENMVYELHSYFWTARSRWTDKLLISDTDPLHAEFLRAGAASVRLAVRPGYEAMVFHYLNTGEIWDGGRLPPIVTPAQSALISNVLARREAEDIDQRIPVGEPWVLRLPTDLVRVSPSPALPRWEQDEHGTWHPVESPE